MSHIIKANEGTSKEENFIIGSYSKYLLFNKQIKIMKEKMNFPSSCISQTKTLLVTN